MAYSADSFTTNEQPSTAKWNKLWSNDASFNDGSGFADNIVLANHLATNAISLGLYESTAQVVVGTVAVPTQITGVSLTVTIPAGGRNILAVMHAARVGCTGTNPLMVQSLWDGTVGSGTQINQSTHLSANSGTGGACESAMTTQRVITPSAGSKTYNGSLHSTTGAVTWNTGGSATSTGFLWIGAI